MNLAQIIQYKEQGLSYYEVLDEISTEGWSERDFRKGRNYTSECVALVNQVYLKERINHWYNLFNGDFNKLSRKFPDLTVSFLQSTIGLYSVV